VRSEVRVFDYDEVEVAAVVATVVDAVSEGTVEGALLAELR
jgi:hypothetical protein